jgi:hypothetical protein
MALENRLLQFITLPEQITTLPGQITISKYAVNIRSHVALGEHMVPEPFHLVGSLSELELKIIFKFISDATKPAPPPRTTPVTTPQPKPQTTQPAKPHPPVDVGEFIKNRLKDANGDSNTPPVDSTHDYNYEGGGSTAGSLSSLNSDNSEKDQDFNFLSGWGPRFNKLANMYGGDED